MMVTGNAINYCNRHFTGRSIIARSIALLDKLMGGLT